MLYAICHMPYAIYIWDLRECENTLKPLSSHQALPSMRDIFSCGSSCSIICLIHHNIYWRTGSFYFIFLNVNLPNWFLFFWFWINCLLYFCVMLLAALIKWFQSKIKETKAILNQVLKNIFLFIIDKAFPTSSLYFSWVSVL